MNPTAIIKTAGARSIEVSEYGPQDLLDLWLSRSSPLTRKAYLADLRDLADWMNLPCPAETVGMMLNAGQGQLNLLVLRYIAHVRGLGRSAATANRRLALVQSLLKFARMLGLTTLSVEVPREKNEPLADTAGPALSRIKEIFADLERRADPQAVVRFTLEPLRAQAKEYGYQPLSRKLGYYRTTIGTALHQGSCSKELAEAAATFFGAPLESLKRGAMNAAAVRNLAIVRLLFHNGLRISEVLGLDMKHYDADGVRLSIKGKQRVRREWITISPKARAALDRWLEVRGDRAGPVFIGCAGRASDRPSRSWKRLDREKVAEMLRTRYGVHPHSFRHAAITQALKATNGNIAKVQRFSRHKNPATVMVYADNLEDQGGQVAKLLDDLA